MKVEQTACIAEEKLEEKSAIVGKHAVEENFLSKATVVPVAVKNAEQECQFELGTKSRSQDRRRERRKAHRQTYSGMLQPPNCPNLLQPPNCPTLLRPPNYHTLPPDKQIMMDGWMNISSPKDAIEFYRKYPKIFQAVVRLHDNADDPKKDPKPVISPKRQQPYIPPHERVHKQTAKPQRPLPSFWDVKLPKITGNRFEMPDEQTCHEDGYFSKSNTPCSCLTYSSSGGGCSSHGSYGDGYSFFDSN